MQLTCFKTLWGYPGTSLNAVAEAKREGYDGIEGPAPSDANLRKQTRVALTNEGLEFIAEIATTGSYVPDRRLTMEDHLKHLETCLAQAAEMEPLFVTCLGGCDAWPITEAIEFFNTAIALAAKHGLVISFETHRGRPTFNPWATRTIVEAIPDIKLTFDISHWCVVCEGLQTTEAALIRALAANAHHIHARVGYDQGPQVPDPTQGVYRDDLEFHRSMWGEIWQNQFRRGFKQTTLTPEFGIDGYEYRDIGGEKALVDVAAINKTMCGLLRTQFASQFKLQ